jgi:hypothetical protein
VEVAVEGPGVDGRFQAELEHTIPGDGLSLERFQVVDVLADRQELLAHVSLLRPVCAPARGPVNAIPRGPCIAAASYRTLILGVRIESKRDRGATP